MINSKLMVGNYVLWNGKIARVHTVTAAEELRLETDLVLSSLDYYHDEVEPIPMSDNIREQIMDQIDDIVKDRENIEGVFTDIVNKGFDYVHQLQIWMASVGFNNNFKLEL